jgi:hypothetical protein
VPAFTAWVMIKYMLTVTAPTVAADDTGIPERPAGY